MTFKQNWEKSKAPLELRDDIVKAMVKSAFPDNTLAFHKIVSGGCANLNIKINLDFGEQFFILRVYLRDKDAAYREQKLGTLLKQTVPMPQVYFIGDCEQYRFAITEYLPGVPLRDLLLSNKPHDVSSIMFEAGKLLSKIHDHAFPTPGFFDGDLNILKTSSENEYIEFAQECLRHPNAIECLNADLITNIKRHFLTYQKFLPDENESRLVHADYDPANILVDIVDGEWKITGILDWEFAFSGSSLFDVANMLRYAHQMPAVFEDSFIQGLFSEGFVLPPHWKETIHLLNLISLLDCLARSSIHQCPNQCADIRELISHINIGKKRITQFYYT